MNCTKNGNELCIKGNSFFLLIGTGCAAMGCFGIRMLFEIFPSVYEELLSGLLGIGFLTLWTSVLFGMSVCSLGEAFRKIKIDDNGIFSRFLFSKQLLRWSELRDWGLSYCGQNGAYTENTYYLYFAKQVQKTKNRCKKKLKGKMIKIIVIGDEYQESVQSVIPFCRERTTVEPFIGEDKFHFLF